MTRRAHIGHWCRREPAPIRGAPFRFRTLHPPDARRDPTADEHTLDRKITVTLAAIPGERHRAKPTMEARW